MRNTFASFMLFDLIIQDLWINKNVNKKSVDYNRFLGEKKTRVILFLAENIRASHLLIGAFFDFFKKKISKIFELLMKKRFFHIDIT